MSTTSSPAALLEPHFTLAQVAEAWGVSTDTVRRMFEGEAGVLVIEPAPARYSRRRYRTIRIPASAVERVRRRMSVVNEKGRG
jgi:methylphosphotriester-DNA--protein-cysteine methyltransferase